MARIFRQLLISLAFIATAHCQTSRGTVTGTVLDSSGAAIKGANATLTSQQTGIRLTTSSNEAGVYRFDAVERHVRIANTRIASPQLATGDGPCPSLNNARRPV